MQQKRLFQGQKVMFVVRKSVGWCKDYDIKFEDEGKSNWKRYFNLSEDTELQFRTILMYWRIMLHEGYGFY